VRAGAVRVRLLVRAYGELLNMACSSIPAPILKADVPAPAPRSLAETSGKLTASATKFVWSSKAFLFGPCAEVVRLA